MYTDKYVVYSLVAAFCHYL